MITSEPFTEHLQTLIAPGCMVRVSFSQTPTREGLERLVQFVELVKEAWTPEPKPTHKPEEVRE